MGSYRLAVATAILMGIAHGAPAYAQTDQLTTDQIRGNSIGGGYNAMSLMVQDLNDFEFGANRFGSSISIGQQGPVAKPFSNVNRGPTVSPYLGLFNTGIIGDEIDAYQSLVRPQLQQIQVNQQFRQQAEAIGQQFRQQQRQVNQAMVQQQRAMAGQLQMQEREMVAAFQEAIGRPAFEPAGNKDLLPTGHRTGFQTTSHYYPPRPTARR